MKSVEDLVVEHIDWMRRKARTYYSEPQDADDLAGETAYRILLYADRYNHASNFKPWASVIMENIYITQYNRRRCVLFTGYPEYDMAGFEKADHLARLNHLTDIIKRYRDKSVCIECVTLYAIGYCYDEIARAVGIPLGTVKSRIAAGRKTLRKALNVSKC